MKQILTFILLLMVFGCAPSDFQLSEDAEKTNNIDLCFKIKNEITLSQCIINLAQKKEADPSICDNFDKFNNLNGKNSCYYQYAKFHFDPKFCEHMSNDKTKVRTTRDDCYSEFGSGYVMGYNEKDPTICTKIENTEDRNMCYFQYNLKYRDASVCEKMEPMDNPYFTKEKCLEISG